MTIYIPTSEISTILRAKPTPKFKYSTFITVIRQPDNVEKWRPWIQYTC